MKEENKRRDKHYIHVYPYMYIMYVICLGYIKNPYKSTKKL